MSVAFPQVQMKFDKIRYILKWISFSSLIGVTVALIALVFQVLVELVIENVMKLNLWVIIFLPVIGLFLSGIITHFFAPEARGAGTDAIIKAYHENWGIVRPRVIGAKLSASILTLGLGGSAGRAGPMVQMGGGLSSLIGQQLDLNLKERRTLVLCGMSACFGAIFSAPLSGAVFACEVVFRDDMEYVNILPCAISSLVGYVTYSLIVPLFNIKDFITVAAEDLEYSFEWSHIFLFLGIGLICGLIGLLYIKFYYYVDQKAESSKRPDWFKTLLGGIGVTILALIFIPIALGLSGSSQNTAFILFPGWHLIQALINNPIMFSLQFLILLLFFKILTTCLTIGSKGSGGVVTPSLVIGGLVGGVVAAIFQPFIGINYAIYIGVTSIVMFASIAHIPLTGMLMGAEIFSIHLIIPTLLGAVVGSWIAAGDSIYHSSLISRSEALKIHKKYRVIEP